MFIYILSGLGADERVFQLLDFSGFQVTFIKWITPEKNERIEDYATRLLEQIPTSKPTLIGLSFGGMIAIEIAKQISTEKIILLSSAKTKNEIPFYYRWIGQLRLHKLLPTYFLKHSNFVSNWLLGATSSFDRKLLKAIFRDCPLIFTKWAIDKVVYWNNQGIHDNLVHIHGTRDRVLPIRFVKCDIEIKNGGHIMTVNKAEELSKTIREILLLSSL
ncbi:MAG: alpha/beta hydrolase [Bacteroidetes bacterium]|nr:alpha/beta hydrolase [Bacteroidota bacterium]